VKKILLVGDISGISQLLRHIPIISVKGLMCASIRPQYLRELKELADSLKVPLLIQPKKENTYEYEKLVRDIQVLDLDLIIINSYSMKLHPDILSIAKDRVYNIHGGLLPEYRGCSPVQWAIINKEIVSGVTLHKVTEEIDCGPIIARSEVSISEYETWVDVTKRIYEKTEILLSENIANVISGTYISAPQDETLAKKWPRRYPEDGRISLNMSVIDIYNTCRALVMPLPGIMLKNSSNNDILIDHYLSLSEIFSLVSKFGEPNKFISNRWKIAYENQANGQITQVKTNETYNHGRLEFILKKNSEEIVGVLILLNISFLHKSARYIFIPKTEDSNVSEGLDFMLKVLSHELALSSMESFNGDQESGL
jgi:methionyl-tRNA formyltransferase